MNNYKKIASNTSAEVNMKPNTTQMPPFTVPRKDVEALKALSHRTRIPQAAYLREALADLLAKYQQASRT